MTQARSLATLLTLSLVLAACGSQGAATGSEGAAASEEPASQPAAAASVATPTDTAPTEAPPEVTPAATEATAGGGASSGGAASGAGACGLITAAEASEVLGRTVSITMDASDQPVAFCIYSDDTGNAVLATSLMARGGAASFSVALSGSGIEKVDGLGDDAAFDPSSASLFVLAGDAVLSVVAGDGREPEAQRRDWAQALARIAVGRM